MKEIGGYIEFEHFHRPMLHEGAMALNCGRNCLAYLIRSKRIKKIALPFLICSSVIETCIKESVTVRFYHIDQNFTPQFEGLNEDEWLYLVNYYGQLDNSILKEYVNRFGHVIIDQAQAYFQMPLQGIDTIYTCRKFFGVADGAFLYTDAKTDDDIPQDESLEHMRFLLGRFERNAAEFYEDYQANNRRFITEPIKRMSKLTNNLLRGIDYDEIQKKRTKNYQFLFDQFKNVNKLTLKREIKGAFAYPLWIEDGAGIRKGLQEKKIYIPTLWPNVSHDSFAYALAQNILPLPCDQRYGVDEMDDMIRMLQIFLKEKGVST